MADRTGPDPSATRLDHDVPVVLASASPRRLELLRRLGVEPAVVPADVDETPGPTEAPTALVARLAATKAEAIVAARPDGDGALVVAADTVVVVEGAVLNKPTSAAEAADMLRRLSGAAHEVLTGIHLRRGDRRAGAVETTTVTFRPLGDDEIAAYVATDEPHDKAGAYGIQGMAGAFVTSITGSDTNVIGLPLSTTVTLAAQLGVRLGPPLPPA